MIKYLIAWVINMLYKEFEKIQEQLINILIDYAYFLKKGAQLNYKYTAEFKDEIPYLGFNYPKFRMKTIFLTN